MTTINPNIQPAPPAQSKVTKAIIWTAISALIASALICVTWILLGTQSGIITKAFLTVGLLTGFAFATIWDVNASSRRPEWVNLASMGAWILILLLGAAKIWSPIQVEEDDYYGIYEGAEAFARIWEFILIVVIVRLAVLHFGLFYKAFSKNLTAFNKATGYITLGLAAVLTGLLVLPLAVRDAIEFGDFYWRLTVAIAILAAVGTALVPLVNALTIPRTNIPQVIPTSLPAGQLPWPTYADGVTPLPVLPNGQPDLQAAYTGHPTYVAPASSTVEPVPNHSFEQTLPATETPTTGNVDQPKSE